MKPIRQIRAAAAFLLFALLPPLGAQDSAVTVVELRKISGEGVQDKELEALEQVIASYVVEMDGFRVVDPAGAELASGDPGTPLQARPIPVDPLPAEITLKARIEKSGKRFVFTIERDDAATGERKTVSERFDSVNDVVLRARSLTRKVFGRDDSSIQPPGRAPSGASAVPRSKTPLSLEDLAGFWKGDKGLDRVRVSKDGKGSAILSSGVSMRVRILVKEGRVIVEQDQPSAAAFFSSPNFSSDVAQRIADQARPMRWIFRLSDDGDSLLGVKESVAVQRGADGVLTIDNGYTRDAVWTRVK